jgi:hypothetical protein
VRAGMKRRSQGLGQIRKDVVPDTWNAILRQKVLDGVHGQHFSSDDLGLVCGRSFQLSVIGLIVANSGACLPTHPDKTGMDGAQSICSQCLAPLFPVLYSLIRALVHVFPRVAPAVYVGIDCVAVDLFQFFVREISILKCVE